MNYSDLLRCPVCFDDFDYDVTQFSSDEEKRSSRLPVLSHQCPHKICASCLNNWQLAAISELKSAKAKPPKWFKCHTCKEKTAFNAVDMKIDTGKCSDIAAIRSLEAKCSGSTANETRPSALKDNKSGCEEDKCDEGEDMELILEAGAARRKMTRFDSSSLQWKNDSDKSIQRLAMVPSIISHVDRKRKVLGRALEEGKSAEHLRDLIDRDEEMKSVEEFLGNGASRRNGNLYRGDQGEQREKKQKDRNENGEATNEVVTSPTGHPCRSDLKTRLEQVGVGSRVGIYWPLDKIYFPATIIATHGQWAHTYAFLYDGGEKESFDLSKHQQFKILDDAVPKAALDAIAVASGGGGDQNNDNDDSPIAVGRTRTRTTTGKDDTAEVQEQGEDWVCPTCEVTQPYQKKLCQCRSTRTLEKGNGKVMLCAIPGCSKKNQGSKCHYMCMRHFTGSKDKQDDDRNGDVAAAVATAKGEETSSKKRARKAPDRFDGQEITKAASFDDGDRKSEAKKPKRSKSAFRSNNKNELSVDEISNLKSRQSSSTEISVNRGAQEDESSEADSDIEEEDCDEAWICLGCGTENAPERKRCSAPCLRWKGGGRNAATSPAKKKPGKSDGGGRPDKRKSSWPKSNRLAGEQEEAYFGAADTPAMKKNPYADRKRRDSPRIPSKNQCGKCDACMVEDCGKCRFCLDMKKFGGPWKIRQKCSSRPPCANPPSMSAKKSKSRALESISELRSGTSRAGRPPRAKPIPPAPPAGSIALDPLKPADGADVPKSTESCKLSFDEKSRVLLAKFNLGSSSSIDPVHKETLLKMMERDDITVVSEGLVGDLNRTLWDMHYVSNLDGDKPYHKVRRFERELIEVPADMPENGKDESDEKIKAVLTPLPLLRRQHPGDQISSREKCAKKRHRDGQSTSCIDEDSGDAFVASVEKKFNVRGRQKRSKAESSEESLFETASDTGGNIKVDEDAMTLDEEGEPLKRLATRKRRRNDEEVDIINDEAIAEAMQEVEHDTNSNEVTKSARKSSATKVGWR